MRVESGWVWSCCSSTRSCKAEAAVLVDHVQELESAAVGGGVELEIHGPHLMRAFGLITVNGAV
jgi:hypothetical protein